MAFERTVYFAICVLLIWYIKTIVTEIGTFQDAKKTTGVVVDVIVIVFFLAALLICINSIISTF